MNTIKYKAAVILGTLTALGPLCTDFYLSALPLMTQSLATSTSAAQLTLTASLVGLGIGQFAFGPISDRVGRKGPLIASLILFIITSLACALAQDISQLIVARFFQGVAGAGGAVLSRAIARDMYSGTSLTGFLALLMTVNGVAPVLAPVMGSLQLTHTGWRGLFISLGMIGTVILALSALGLKETRIKASASDNQPAGALGVLKDKTFLSFSLLQGFMMAGMFAYIGASSYVFQDIYHMSPMAFSLTFAVNGVGLILSSLIISRISRTAGEVKILGLSLMLALVFSVLLFTSFWITLPLWSAIILLFLAVSINSGICTLASSIALQQQSRNSGSASAWLGMMMFSMGGISAPLTGIGGTSGVSMSAVILVSYCLAAVFFLFGKRAYSNQSDLQRFQ
ncbi:DHA1 family bicyclomycin/chloramphenicol resistance-like MFS transporter [Pantoea dispersa]|uniref:multidrug effflux MFS transporter n=1 Tax=Pantoea dispersa TaxID=59814 RepID=UPI003D1D11B3